HARLSPGRGSDRGPGLPQPYQRSGSIGALLRARSRLPNWRRVYRRESRSMSLNSESSRISVTRPKSVSCRYQSLPSITLSATRGSRCMLVRRRRVASMLTSTCVPSQSYHVTAVCGEPSARSVAITAGFARRRSASASGGSGSFGIRLRPLAPVALEPEVGLDERCSAEVRLGPLALGALEVGLRGSDELLLRRPVVDALRPDSEVVAGALDVLGDLVDARDGAEVDQRQPLGLVAEHLVERPLPRLEVDVGRWRVRKDVLPGQDAHPGRITREQGAVVQDVTDVVRGVPGRRKRLDACCAVP